MTWISCGHHTITWDDWVGFSRICDRPSPHWMNEAVLYDESWVEASRTFLRLVKSSDLSIAPQNWVPAARFVANLLDIHRLRVSDKGDIVYATRRLIFAEPTENLLPDYSISLSHFCHDVTAFILQAVVEAPAKSPYLGEAILSVLALPAVQKMSRNTEFPSWVPDLGTMSSDCNKKLLCYRRESRHVSSGGAACCTFCSSQGCRVLTAAALVVASTRIIGKRY